MPTSYHLNLATWHTINALYAQKTQLALQNMRYDIVDPTGVDRLLRLTEQRAGHWLAMQVEEAKIAPTEQDSHRIDLARIEDDLQVLLDRPLFDQAIDGLLQRIRAGVDELLNRAGVSHAEVDTIFFTGGSSSVPALRQSVAALLPNARATEGNSFGSIGSGLAIEAARRYG